LAEGKIKRVDRGKAAKRFVTCVVARSERVEGQLRSAQRPQGLHDTDDPLGANATKTTRSTPTSIRLSTEEIVTVVTC
jgi:hypothetical protein